MTKHKNMLLAIEKNLYRGISLLENLTDEEYSNTTIAPYYSSIGVHIRHILDVFDCIFDGLEDKKVDLAARKRNPLAENHTEVGITYFKTILQKIKSLENTDMNQLIAVSDNLGLGIVVANYTLAAALIQAHSHAIHHFASLGYLIAQLDIELPDADFGYNPTTPRVVV